MIPPPPKKSINKWERPELLRQFLFYLSVDPGPAKLVKFDFIMSIEAAEVARGLFML